MTALLLIHVAATLTMFGVILVVQLVHYPLFAYVGAGSYEAYQRGHMTRITWIVAPVMLLELVTALALAWWQPLGLPPWQVWTGLGLVALIWTTTGLVHVPLHQTLRHGFNPSAHRTLVRTNWIRTLAWASAPGWGLRAGLVLWMTTPLLQSS